MGYFLIHHQDIFGIIGVEEHYDDWGRAVIFNATGIDPFIHGTSKSMMLDLVYSELKYPCKTFLYANGLLLKFEFHLGIPTIEKLLLDRSSFTV